jgi:UDPglucose--hexose-1-phosphate uridylyltransferase
MNETRYDWLADRWVIFSPNRERRPNEFLTPANHSPQSAPPERDRPACPFCRGNEEQTPDASLILLRDGKAIGQRPPPAKPSTRPFEWLVRVVPNKFSALTPGEPYPGMMPPESDSPPTDSPPTDSPPTDSLAGHRFPPLLAATAHQTRLPTYCVGQDVHPAAIARPTPAARSSHVRSHPSAPRTAPEPNLTETLFQRLPADGIQEVIIESPQHALSLTELPTDHVSLVLDAYCRRLNHWRAHQQLRYAVVFKNSGPAAGATLSHSHSQLIATHFVPPAVDQLCHRLQQFHRQTGDCAQRVMVDAELQQGDRIVTETGRFALLAPFASYLPYLLWLVPQWETARFEEIEPEDRRQLARLLQQTLLALETMHPGVSYNFCLHTIPFREHGEHSYQWRLEIFPRLQIPAGFECSSQCFINPVLPEQAAAEVRAYLGT